VCVEAFQLLRGRTPAQFRENIANWSTINFSSWTYFES
jgi:hypothetical protein